MEHFQACSRCCIRHYEHRNCRISCWRQLGYGRNSDFTLSVLTRRKWFYCKGKIVESTSNLRLLYPSITHNSTHEIKRFYVAHTQLTSVQYMDPDVNIQPRIFQQHSTAKVKVVAQAGNSQVGFSSALAKVDDGKRNSRITFEKLLLIVTSVLFCLIQLNVINASWR